MNVTAIPASVNRGASQLALFGVLTAVGGRVLETVLGYTVGRLFVAWGLWKLGYLGSELVLSHSLMFSHQWFARLFAVAIGLVFVRSIIHGYLHGGVCYEDQKTRSFWFRPIWTQPNYGAICGCLLCWGLLSTTVIRTLHRPGLASQEHAAADRAVNQEQLAKSSAYVRELESQLAVERLKSSPDQYFIETRSEELATELETLQFYRHEERLYSIDKKVP